MAKVKGFHRCDYVPKAVNFELTKKECPEWPDFIRQNPLKEGLGPP